MLHDRGGMEANEPELLHRNFCLLQYIPFLWFKRAPALDDALGMALPHGVHIIVADRPGLDGGLEIQRHQTGLDAGVGELLDHLDRKSTRLNSSHANISYAVFCLKKKKKPQK